MSDQNASSTRCSDPVALIATTTADHPLATAIQWAPAQVVVAREQSIDKNGLTFVIQCSSVALSGHTCMLCDLLSACCGVMFRRSSRRRSSAVFTTPTLLHPTIIPDALCMSHRRRNHSYGFISSFHHHDFSHWLRQLRAICLSAASLAQLLGFFIGIAHSGFGLVVIGCCDGCKTGSSRFCCTPGSLITLCEVAPVVDPLTFTK